MKKISVYKVIMMLLSVVLLATSIAAAPAPQQPNVTFTLVQGLPATMQVGESYTVIVKVESDVSFATGVALPDAFFPGRYVVAAKGDHSGAGTTAILSVTFTAKASTAQLPPYQQTPGGVAPVAVVAGAHFQGGYAVTQRFDFLVAVP